MATLKISARNAGQAALEKFCPRCAWYLLRIKKWPFQFGMPGVMFYLEQVQKAFLLAYLAKHGKLPDSFGPFADCTEPVEFPFRMQAMHEETGVLVTAQADLMLRKPSGNICLLDLKTSKVNGGGKIFLPQYMIQVIGYSWVTEAAGVGDVDMAGLLYCEIQHETVKNDPLMFQDDDGVFIPFHFTPHQVALDYKRFAECLKEMNKVWNSVQPPRGAQGCKDCALLNYVLDFEAELRGNDALNAAMVPLYRDAFYTHQYERHLACGGTDKLKESMKDKFSPEDEGGMWATWDFTDFED